MACGWSGASSRAPSDRLKPWNCAKRGSHISSAAAPQRRRGSPTGRELPLARCEIVPDHLSGLHHEPHALELADVLEWVRSDGHEVGELTGLNRADAILPAEHLG